MVRAWGARWVPLTFGEQQGVGLALGFRRAKAKGFAHREKGKWFVVYECNGELRFYAGGTVVRVGVGELRSADLGKNCRELQVHAEGQLLVRIYYSPARHRWWSRLDPTFDALDEEASDFFLWVARLWGDAGLRDEIRKRWATTNVNDS